MSNKLTTPKSILIGSLIIAGSILYTNGFNFSIVPEVIRVNYDGKSYKIKCERSPRLFGELLPYNATTFVAKWNDRSYDADVFMQFTFNEKEEVVSATMKPIAPITDFSFDFQDLELKKTK